MAKECELTRYVPARCARCEEPFNQEQAAYAVHNLTGERASGYTGRGGYWYGMAGPEHPWAEGEYHLQWSNVYSVGGPYDMCEDCTIAQLHARQSNRELLSDCPPDWFDSSYAGERWDDNY